MRVVFGEPSWSNTQQGRTRASHVQSYGDTARATGEAGVFRDRGRARIGWEHVFQVSRRRAGRTQRAAPGSAGHARSSQVEPSCCRAAAMPRHDWLSGRCWWPLWPSAMHACLSARPPQQRVCESPRCRNGGAHAGSRPGLGARLSRACPPSHPAVVDFPTAPGG